MLSPPHRPEVDSRCDSTLNIWCRAKGFQHQRMTNGAMNVEIGNPAYKIYEGEPDDDAGELLDADFTLDPDKVTAKEPGHTETRAGRRSGSICSVFAAHQLHKPRVRHAVHGRSQQPQLPGQHRREQRAAITWRRGAPRGPPGVDCAS